MHESVEIEKCYNETPLKVSKESEITCKQCVDEPCYELERMGITCLRDGTDRKKCNGSDYYVSKFGVKKGRVLKKKDQTYI